jgi:ABC-2 type transport system permease protein
MSKALLVARWEFRAAVFRRAYFIAVFAMPLLMFGLGSISVLTVPSTLRASASKPIAIVDKAGILDLAAAAEQAARRDRLRADPSAALEAQLATTVIGNNGLAKYDEQGQALGDLQSGKVSAVYVIETDYLETGNLTGYGQNLSIFGQAAANQRQTMVADAIRASLLHKTVSSDVLARTYAPVARLKRLSQDKTGQIQDATDAFGAGRLVGTFGVFMLLTMAIFFSAGFLQQATMEDRQNRVFEVLLSSVDADDLILGKIIGLGGAGLLQVGIYIVFIVGVGATALPFLDVPIGRLALSLVYFIIGYLMFASLMATVGMIARTAQESAQLSALWTFTAIAPMFFITSIATFPNGVISRILSFFPLSSPVTMLLRLTTAPEVPLVDIIASIVIGGVAVYAFLRGAVKIFRAATLMYGKRPTLPELIHWLRAS